MSDCADKRSISPERFGCCHGQDQARVSIIANFINRAFCWVSLRGVARVWHAALTASTVSKQHAGMRGGERAGLDWQLATGDRAQSGLTSQRKRASWGDAVLGWQLT